MVLVIGLMWFKPLMGSKVLWILFGSSGLDFNITSTPFIGRYNFEFVKRHVIRKEARDRYPSTALCADEMYGNLIVRPQARASPV